MQRFDIASSLGNGLALVKYTVAYGDLAVQAAGTAPITLYPSTDPGGLSFNTPSTTAPPNALNFQIPQAGQIYYCKIHPTVAFSGGSLTAMTVSVGKLGGSATFIAPAFNIYQAVSDTTLQETFAIPSGQVSAWGVTFTFTGDGTHNINGVTAGSVDIYLTYSNVSVPVSGTGASLQP